jgi:DNA polymerase I
VAISEGIVRTILDVNGRSDDERRSVWLKRARDQDLAIHPGQDIEYVVVDDEKTSRERAALAHEEIEIYDVSYYETQLIRAVESMLSPLGWDRSEIRQELVGS